MQVAIVGMEVQPLHLHLQILVILKNNFFSRWDFKLIRNLRITSHTSVNVGGFLFKYVDWYGYQVHETGLKIITYLQREKQLSSASLHFWPKIESLVKISFFALQQKSDFQVFLIASAKMPYFLERQITF